MSEYLNSFKDTFKNLVLLLPRSYAVISGTVLGLIFFFLGLSNFQGQNLTNTIIISGLIVLIYILVLTYFQAANAASVRKFVDKGKVTHSEQMNEGLLIFWKYLGMSIIIGLIALIIIGSIGFLLFAIINPSLTFGSEVGLSKLIMFILLLLPAIFLVAIIITMIFLYSSAIITEKNSTVGKALLNSYHLMKHNFKHTLFVAAVVILFSIVYMICVYIVSLPVVFIEAGASILSGATNNSSNIASNTIIGLLSVPLAVTNLIFIFRSKKYLDRKKQ